MKVGIYTDVHYGQYSSILRMRGQHYSKRLENCIQSLNWAEQLFQEQKCDMVVCLGDFFDHAQLGAEELTALNELKVGPGRHVAIVGNHEITNASRTFNSMSILQRLHWEVISAPQIEAYCDCSFIYLPYIVEEERKPLADYCQGVSGSKIIFSHNDIKGIRYGAFVSEEGFDLKEIEQESSLFLNGHLHNGQFLNEAETILNLGNLTGQNFGEDAFHFKHYACIMDTSTLELQFFENPYAFNFVKVDLTAGEDLQSLREIPNAVATIRTYEDQVASVRQALEELPVVANRVLIVPRETQASVTAEEVIASIDHLDLFKTFTLEKLGNTTLVQQELAQLMEG